MTQLDNNLSQYSFKNFKPREHQLQAVNFALSRFDLRALISCATGTGKAMMKIIIGVFLIKKFNLVDKYIVVAPPKGKISVEDDIALYTNINLYYITDLESFIQFFKQDKQRFGIMTYEMKKKLTYKKDGKIILYPEVEKIINTYRIGFSFDEIHKVKTGTSLVNRCFSLLTSNSTSVFGFTGTILMKSVEDIYYICDFIRPKMLGSIYSFQRTFIVYRELKLGMKVVPVPAYLKNLDKLRDKLEPIMFSYFPPVDINFEQYKCEMTQETRERYFQIAIGLLENPNELMRDSEDDYDKDEDIILSHSSRMVKMQYCVDEDNEKQKLLLSVVKDCIHEGCIVYVSYHHTLAILRTLFTENNLEFMEIHGKMTEKNVRSSLKWFTTDSKNKILIITDAGSASINIQSTPNLILFNCMYSLGSYFQLLGRIVRMNSKFDRYNIKTIVTNDTIDLYKANYVTSNKEVYTTMFGNKIKLPTTQASGSFNSYFLQELRNKFMWQVEKTFQKKDEQRVTKTPKEKSIKTIKEEKKQIDNSPIKPFWNLNNRFK